MCDDTNKNSKKVFHSLSLKMVESYKLIPYCKVYPMLLTLEIFCFSPWGHKALTSSYFVCLMLLDSHKQKTGEVLWGWITDAQTTMVLVAARTIALLNSKTDQLSALRLGGVHGSHRWLLRT